ncbi:MAG: hypothetical protein A2Y03_01395 [Omnitrophica WOR_2 bacterium GWF2_38_59]|nr:MAG: hypothetical protein A2Y03_01395 [Omnitrophica WOR_2 bacterium GWF2_38_59]OGX49726.1 MAG: hypothetical protein A2243_10860 [Omnitrophica WOR_2 bacterium RIFOXYA2_FULL_38_17]OGX52513.1 MAG: hypothetical protein A2267_05015 [Omnitrophica WOR_2 bacterium RIFOXYA12_FULL_38_10]OGX60129.1 MAG: hypothetical protein A2306_08885 [Omnitrophica WOR_2 bacterium RIFOXYB2_FULL_38_16]HBG61447.1 hypothetical protein [Candidatus Omnitrophota bacterium]
MIDLIDGGIQNSNLFLHMPLFDEVYYEGYHEGKIRKYRAIREDQKCDILVLNVIRKSEDIIWDSLEDLLKRSVSEAAFSVHGVYIFDLLTMDIHKELKTYNHNELKTLLINIALKLKPGEQKLIKYSSVYGLFQKTVHESWGKIAFKTSVEVFKDKSSYLDLLIKQLLKNVEFAHDPAILLLNDLSQTPIFDPKDDEQQERLKKFIEKKIPTSIEFPPEVYIQDKNGVRELLSGDVIV